MTDSILPPDQRAALEFNRDGKNNVIWSETSLYCGKLQIIRRDVQAVVDERGEVRVDPDCFDDMLGADVIGDRKRREYIGRVNIAAQTPQGNVEQAVYFKIDDVTPHENEFIEAARAFAAFADAFESHIRKQQEDYEKQFNAMRTARAAAQDPSVRGVSPGGILIGGATPPKRDGSIRRDGSSSRGPGTL